MALGRNGGWFALLLSLLCAGTAFSVTKCAAETKPGYVLLNLEGTVSRWPETSPEKSVLITYGLAEHAQEFLDARNCRALQPISAALKRSEIGEGTFRSELRKAFELWERITNVRFVPATDAADANIIIGAQIKPTGYAFTDVALTPPNEMTPRRIRRALICLNPARRWKVGFDGNMRIYDLRYTLAHEIGHAIGLDHAGQKGQLMDFRYSETIRAPQAGDVAGAVALYGESSMRSARSNDPTLQARPGTPGAEARSERGTMAPLGLGVDNLRETQQR